MRNDEHFQYMTDFMQTVDRYGVATVGITEWMNELDAANKRVSQLMMDRYGENAMKTDLVLKQVRTDIDKTYRDITARINALALVDETGNYAEFIRLLNAIIARYVNTVAQRTGKAAAKKN